MKSALPKVCERKATRPSMSEIGNERPSECLQGMRLDLRVAKLEPS